MKVSSTPTTGVNVTRNVDKSSPTPDIAAHWLPTAATLTIMDPNQPSPLMKLPISIEHDSIQFHTTVLVDSATTLNFASQDFLTRNNLSSKCVSGPKIVVRIANEQRISTTNFFFLIMCLLVRTLSLVLALQFYHI